MSGTSSKSFGVGERVEAIWNLEDTERFSGRIIGVAGGDSYDVLFDDGVRSRRKGIFLFKLEESPSSSSSSSEPPPRLEMEVGLTGVPSSFEHPSCSPPPPSLPVVKSNVPPSTRPNSGRSSNRPARNFLKASNPKSLSTTSKTEDVVNQNQKSQNTEASGALPPPPPLLCRVTNKRRSRSEALYEQDLQTTTSSNPSPPSPEETRPELESAVVEPETDDSKPPTIIPETDTTTDDTHTPLSTSVTTNGGQSQSDSDAISLPSTPPPPVLTPKPSLRGNMNSNSRKGRRGSRQRKANNKNNSAAADADFEQAPVLEQSVVNTNGNSASSSPLPLTPVIPILPSTATTMAQSVLSSSSRKTSNTTSPSVTTNGGTITTTPATESSTSPGSSSKSHNSTKKGFVYVQQPHYSVFDLPQDLGKRQRRVHNYSMLAKGSASKKRPFGVTNGIDTDLIDGESTPTSTPSTSRCSSPIVSGVTTPTTPISISVTSPKNTPASTTLTTLTTTTTPTSTSVTTSAANSPAATVVSKNSSSQDVACAVASVSAKSEDKKVLKSESCVEPVAVAVATPALSTSISRFAAKSGESTLPTTGSTFVRRRRFLKSPPKTSPSSSSVLASRRVPKTFGLQQMQTTASVPSPIPSPSPSTVPSPLASPLKTNLTTTPQTEMTVKTPTSDMPEILKVATPISSPSLSLPAKSTPRPPPPLLLPLNLTDVTTVTAEEKEKPNIAEDNAPSYTEDLSKTKSKPTPSPIELEATGVKNAKSERRSVPLATSTASPVPPIFTPPAPLPQPAPPIPALSSTLIAAAEEIPTKRLRKPSSRFMSEEDGYVDIFSKKRTPKPTPTRAAQSDTKSPFNSQQRKRAPRANLIKQSSPFASPGPDSPSSYTSSDKSKSRKKKGSIGTVEAEPDDLSISCDRLKDKSSPIKTTESLQSTAGSDDSSGDEELPDITEYGVGQIEKKRKRGSSSSPKKTKLKFSLSAQHSSPASCSPRLLSPTATTTKKPEPLESQLPLGPPKAKADGESNLPAAVPSTSFQAVTSTGYPIRTTSRGRIVRPPPLKEPSIVLHKLPIKNFKLVVNKCDRTTTSQPPTKSTSALKSKRVSSPEKDERRSAPIFTESDDVVVVDDEMETGEIQYQGEVEVVPKLPSSSALRKRWKKNHRWQKGRVRPRSLITGVRSGMRLHDSRRMQLLKRSAAFQQQRRLDGKGRPKESLLKGITKKRLKRIMESIKRRKLKRKKIIVATKFKDVRVDIINCVCGRTDEFGLMVQCETCMCWQHGNCFGYCENSKIPRFYVCQSCATPKKVRPSYRTEGIRQESYKKGILPAFSFGPRPSSKQHKILKRCHELNKMIASIENSIRQNRLKEIIAATEPEHKKLYQWSAPRPHPKDLIQKWQFNKYYKTVLRRLLLKHKGKPEYIEKLTATITFREKFKKYTQAFEEAKAAISRKIGSRGLSLVDKLSEQESKSVVISGVKEKLDSEFSQLPESMKNCLLSNFITTERQFSRKLKFPPEIPRSPESSPTKENKLASKSMIQNFTSKYAGLLDAEEFDEISDNNSSPEDGGKTGEALSDKQSEDSEVEIIDEVKSPASTPSFQTVDKENEKVAEEIMQFNLDQLQDQEHDGDAPVLTDDESDNWMEVKKTGRSLSDSDVIKLTLSQSPKSRSPRKDVNLTPGSIGSGPEIESEIEASLSGDTTVSVEDSEGGEEYWYNPITQLNTEYDSTRKFLLHAPLTENGPGEKADDRWQQAEVRSVKRDWLDDLDFFLNVDCGLELDDISDYDGSTSSSTSEIGEEVELDEDDSLGPPGDETDSTDSSTEEDDMEQEPSRLRYWQRALLDPQVAIEDPDKELEDEDWKMDVESESSLSDVEEDDVDMEDVEKIPQQTERQEKSSEDFRALLVVDDPTLNHGEIVDVRIPIGDTQKAIGPGVVVCGSKNQKFIKLLKGSDNLEHGSFAASSTESVKPLQSSLLCKSCEDSFGSKWTWQDLNSSKGIKIVVEDVFQTLANEVNRVRQLGISTLDAKLLFDFPHPDELKSKLSNFSSDVKKPAFELPKLVDLCRAAISKNQNKRVAHPTTSHPLTPAKSSSSSASASTSKPSTSSAEQDSIFSLLSLSKNPVEFNGENVSELSIESLRKLTERLQQNGPLTEDLAKAVTGYPLTNGKIGLDKLTTPLQTSSSSPQTCIRCMSSKEEYTKELHVLQTSNASLASANLNENIVQEWCKQVLEAVENSQLQTYTLKKVLFEKVKHLAERKEAESTARKLGIKITPENMKRRFQVIKPDQYLNRQKSDLTDALMPYAQHFISRFTKKDELPSAKKAWIKDMVQHYNCVKMGLKDMFSVENEEARVGAEDKFYMALDNLRKSFDIVLTKKDIKMRRQKQSLSLSDPNALIEVGEAVPTIPISTEDSTPQEEEQVDTGVSSTDASTTETPSSDVILTNGGGDVLPDVVSTSEIGMGEEVALLPVPDQEEGMKERQSEPAKGEQNGGSGEEMGTDVDTVTSQDLELLSRLVNNSIPMQMQEEEMNAFLSMTGDVAPPVTTTADRNLNGAFSNFTPISTTSNPPSEEQSLILQTSTPLNDKPATEAKPIESESTSSSDQPMEDLDDFRLIEENLNDSVGALGAGDIDLNLINTIGGTEDGDLLLNVFDPIFSDVANATTDEPQPCSSRSITSNNPPRTQPTTAPFIPSLAKLTPEMCKGFLLDDIRAHQQVIDSQLDRLEAEIMDLERRRGNGLKDKDDPKLFDMLYTNMQILLENSEVLNQLVQNNVGVDNNAHRFPHGSGGFRYQYQDPYRRAPHRRKTTVQLVKVALKKRGRKKKEKPVSSDEEEEEQERPNSETDSEDDSIFE